MAGGSVLVCDCDTANEHTEHPIAIQSSTRVIFITCYAKGRPAPSNPSQKFATFLTELTQEPFVKWSFSAEPLSNSHDAHDDIFPLQVRSELNLNDGEAVAHEDFQDLRSSLRDQVFGFCRDHQAAPLLLLFSPLDSNAAIQRKYTKTELLGWPTDTGRDGAIATGDPAISEAGLEVLYAVAGIACFFYGCYKGTGWLAEVARDFRKPPPSHNNDAVNDTSGFAAFIKQASTPFWNRQRLQSITHGRRQLKDDCLRIKNDFEALEDKMNIVFAPESNDDKRNPHISLSTQEILEITQLATNLSNSQLANKQTLNELFPLLEEEYSQSKKVCHRTVAVAGGAVALYVAAAVLGPWSLWGAVWLTGHGAASSSIFGAGVATAGNCGVMGQTNADQLTKRDNVRKAEERLRKERSQFLCWLVPHLVGEERFRSLDSKERSDIYKKLGVQIDLVDNANYRVGGLKIAWEGLSDATREYLNSCQELEKGVE